MLRLTRVSVLRKPARMRACSRIYQYRGEQATVVYSQLIMYGTTIERRLGLVEANTSSSEADGRSIRRKLQHRRSVQKIT